MARSFFRPGLRNAAVAAKLGATAETVDLFDRLQLAHVFAVCRRERSLSAAGRKLFGASRLLKARPNDADRLRKFLARYGLTFDAIR
jgi:transcriptional regulatory protein RtcR